MLRTQSQILWKPANGAGQRAGTARLTRQATAATIVLLLFVHLVPCRAGECNRSLFKVKLSDDGCSLLAEVEKFFGPLGELEQEDLAKTGKDAESGIDTSGHAFIRIDPRIGRSEPLLLHELWHLKLTIAGFSWLQINRAGPGSIEVNALLSKYEWAFSQILISPIQHTMFPESVRALLETHGMNSAESRAMITDEDYLRLAAGLDPIERTEALFVGLLDQTDQTVNEKELTGYRKAGWSDEAETAERMVKLVRSASLKTPKQMEDLVAAVLNTLFSGKIHFEPAGMDRYCRGAACCPRMILKASRAN